MSLINLNKLKVKLLLLIFMVSVSSLAFTHEIPKPSINSGLVVVYDKAFDSLSGSGVTIDNSDIAVNFSLTYPVSPSIAFETGVISGFDASVDLPDSNSGTLHGKSYSTDGTLTLKAQTDTSYLAGMKFSTSVNKPLNFYARTGLIFWDVDFKVSGSGTLTYNGSTYNSKSFLKVDGSDPYLGLGLSYKANDRSSLSFDYHTLASTNAIQGAAFDISSYSISWLINF